MHKECNSDLISSLPVEITKDAVSCILGIKYQPY